MRELKFRAWDGIEMITPDFIKKDGRAIWGTNELTRISGEVMQFTGITDKNGVDIFEGDICTIKHRRGYGYTWVIEYERMGFVARATDHYPDCPIRTTSTKFLSGLEVVGNIYQHQNLLTCDFTQARK